MFKHLCSDAYIDVVQFQAERDGAMKKKSKAYVMEVLVEVRVEASSFDDAKTLAEDNVLSGSNGCEAAIIETRLIEVV